MMRATKEVLGLLLLAVFAAGSVVVLAAGPNVSGGGRDALTADFGPIPPTKGRGDGQYMELQGSGSGISVVLNANSRLALEKLDADGNTLAVLNTHLGITVDNYKDTTMTLFIGTDEDGDGTCLQEGPNAICKLVTGDLSVNEDDVLHVSYALAVRTEGDKLKGDGTCWVNFDAVTVMPLVNDDGVMYGVEFEIEGGEVGMPDINAGDGSIVGFDGKWLFNNDCKANSTCQVVPVLTTDDSYDTGGQPWF